MIRRSMMLALVLAMATGGCAVSPGSAGGEGVDGLPGGKADDASGETDEETFELPLDIHWVRNSAEYQAAVVQAYGQATRSIEELAADREPGTWAVALDADETVLSNSLYQMERAELGLGYSWQSWRSWVSR